MKKSDAEEVIEPPIAFRPCSNGEYAPPAETRRDRMAIRRFREIVEEKHRRVGMTRREFARSVLGHAAALAVINEVYGCGGGDEGGGRGGVVEGGAGGGGGGPGGGMDGGGRLPDARPPGTMDGSSGGMPGVVGRDAAGFDAPESSLEDAAEACERLMRDEFIFDVQMHAPNPLTPWTDRPLSMDAETFIRTAFVESDTAVGVISGIPGARGLGLPNVEARRMAQEIVERFGGPRLFYHANVAPNNGASELEYMEQIVAGHQIAAWKVYPHDGAWRLDSDAIGLPFVERAVELGVPIIAAHRGIAADSGDYAAPSSPVDLTSAARQAPDATFLCYHSGWQSNVDENHPYDPTDANPRGVDRLIRGLLENDVGPGDNVYAELGSTWRNLMTRPEAAAHVLGKLLLYLGEDRILWGTDSVFTGSPQEQIVALRAFVIPESMQDAFGYPALTDTAKRKIFGLNAAALYGIDPEATLCEIRDDFVDRLRTTARLDERTRPAPERRHGPVDRREFLRLAQYERWFGLA